jgi:hypothetical protein
MVSGPFEGHTDESGPSHFHLMANGLPLAPMTNPFVFGMPRLVRWSLAPSKATQTMSSVAFSSDGKRIASGS